MPTRIALLLALLGPAHAAVADAADSFTKWEKDVATFEKADEAAPPPKHAVLFVGSSSVRMWDVKKSFPGREVINRGFGGSQLADAVHFVDRLVLKHEPRVVVLYAGDNDLANGKTPRQIADDFRAFVGAVRVRLPETRIVYVSIKPSPKRWNLVEKVREANALIADLCEEGERLAFLNVFTPMLGEDGRPRPELFARDELHMNAEGYRLWTELLTPLLDAP